MLSLKKRLHNLTNQLHKMQHLKRKLNKMHKAHKAHKAEIMAHRKLRTVHLGEHLSLQFESETSIRYQIQEMLRIEKIFDEGGIQQEIDAYAPLVPDGSNWKATMLIEYPDENERKRELARLIGVEDRVFVEVEGHARVYAIADEDLDRENEEKTSSVHFVRFELTREMAAALKYGMALAMGIDHPAYTVKLEAVPAETRAALVKDLA